MKILWHRVKDRVSQFNFAEKIAIVLTILILFSGPLGWVIKEFKRFKRTHFSKMINGISIIFENVHRPLFANCRAMTIPEILMMLKTIHPAKIFLPPKLLLVTIYHLWALPIRKITNLCPEILLTDLHPYQEG